MSILWLILKPWPSLTWALTFQWQKFSYDKYMYNVFYDKFLSSLCELCYSFLMFAKKNEFVTCIQVGGNLAMTLTFYNLELWLINTDSYFAIILKVTCLIPLNLISNLSCFMVVFKMTLILADFLCGHFFICWPWKCQITFKVSDS